MASHSPITHESAKHLLQCLYFFHDEEHARPWSINPTFLANISQTSTVTSQVWDSLLFRIFDRLSGSQPDGDNRMQARDASMRLDDVKVRRDTLTIHANHSKWVPTPYISFTTSKTALEDYAKFRSENTNRKGGHRVVVVDPRVRLALGLPILHFHDEMKYYDIPNPYRVDYYQDHFLCLWEVTPEEVVGIWNWDELQHDPDWIDNIVMPEVERHRLKSQNLIERPMTPTRPVEASVKSIDLPGFEAGSANDRKNRFGFDKDNADFGTGLFDEFQDDEDYDDNFDDDLDDDDVYCSGSEDSYERVCEENYTGELMNMLDGFGI